jgi:hypothetical protein
MGKTLSLVGSAVVGVALAAVAGWAIFASQTAAPDSNPAGAQIVTYGQR